MSVRRFFAFLSLFLIASLPVAAPLPALAQQPAAATPAAAGATVHGVVVDPDNALVPGATVTITPASGKAQSTTSKADGTYTFRSLPAGSYTVTAAAPGFAPYSSQPVTVATGANLTSDVHMDLATTAQTVNVTTDTVQLSVDPENNASSTVITGDALNALSDDPDELQSELQALAGPSAGPNGGQIYIDGFTGGQLPPKSSILAIRINSNPFSAQYDQLGYGRIEILTKPGTDKIHGNASFQGSDKVFDTSTPFLGATNNQPDFHTLFALGNVTGPIRPGMSYSVGGSYRDQANNNIINPADIYSASPTSTTVCAPGVSTLGACTANPYPTIDRAAPAPATRWDINPRFDTMLGGKNTLTVRYDYEHAGSTNNGGTISLPALGSTSTSAESTIQVSDTQVLSDKIINETRFEWQRDTSSQSPFNTGVGVSVGGYFSAFGTGGGSINATNETHYEVQNYTSIQLVKNFVRLGGRLRTTGETISSNGGVNGSLSYSYLLDPCQPPSTLPAGYTAPNPPAGCPTETQPCQTIVATISSYQCGTPYAFSQTLINKLGISARQTDGEFYAEDDWKITPNLTWSYGLRLETQNYIDSTHDFAPRTSLAWGVPRKNGKTTTVLRAGAGIFYNRFSLGQIASIVQNNPANQTGLSYLYPGVGCTPTSTAACTTGTGTAQSRTTIPVAGNGLRSAYVIESALTLEQQVGKYASVTVTYLNARGEHQFLTRTFPITSGYCVNPSTATSGYLSCTQSEGVFRQNQINTNINVRTPKGTSIFGYYSANWADSNLSGITNPYNSAVDYGRAGFAVRSRMNLGGTIPLPFLITASPLIFAQSGSPYNLTTGVDNNLDGDTDDRPGFTNGVVPPSWAACTSSKNFSVETVSTTPIAGENYTQIPVNYCTGPANIGISMRLSRTFGFGPLTEAGAAQQRRGGGGGGGGLGGPGGGPGGGGFGGGGFGGGGGRGGGGGGGRGGGGGGGRGSNTGHKYNLTLGAQALNLFNEIPYGTPVSSLSSAYFGKQISLATGQQFATANAVRRITLQANFSF